ncbi:hypothetical protein SAMN04487950_1657 [Halogranum rubrum]|uniref:Uncharacterized protein n=1 Tax=Halogranum rubrum TaxID=553466 RepID=A0A1I4D8V7_9EURY|nr:hypothetical protein SAMN04487950_1657 [Halogranum rubrum]
MVLPSVLRPRRILVFPAIALFGPGLQFVYSRAGDYCDVAFAYQKCFEANPFRYIAFVMLVALASYLGATVFVTLFPVEQWASRWWLARSRLHRRVGHS